MYSSLLQWGTNNATTTKIIQNLNINMNVLFAIANDSVYNTSDSYTDGFFIAWNKQITTNHQVCFLTNKVSINQYTWLALGQ